MSDQWSFDRRLQSQSFLTIEIAIGDHHLVKRSQDDRDHEIQRSQSQKCDLLGDLRSNQPYYQFFKNLETNSIYVFCCDRSWIKSPLICILFFSKNLITSKWKDRLKDRQSQSYDSDRDLNFDEDQDRDCHFRDRADALDTIGHGHRDHTTSTKRGRLERFNT